ncbi:unnamed protein product [Clonostachys solani]|uniref:Uncharacterized protein n=1 Tax=Clonostachys solani TaxID=160281 RepID=A0A9N9ZDB6_9HYPO|nr:unnamed protein product [Clonostachys solani]
MLEHAGYSQAPSPGTSFSGVTTNGAPNAHYYLNSGKATSQQHNATTNNHHPRPNGTGNHSNSVGGVNNGINASFNPGASTTTTTTNTNSTTSHANGASNKGSAGPGAGGGSITVTVTATTTTTTTATATATTNANTNSHPHPHAYPAGTPNSTHHHQHAPSSSGKKVKTKRTKRAFAPHSITASRPAPEKTPSASSSPITCRHEFNLPKSASHQENPPAKIHANSAGWNSIKRSVSCASPSLANAGRSANPGLKEQQQRSSSTTTNTANLNAHLMNGSLPVSVNQVSEPATTFGSYSQRPPTDMLSATNAPGEVRKDHTLSTAPRPQNGQANSRPSLNGLHKEFSASPTFAMLFPDIVVANPKSSKNGTTPTSTASKQRPTKPPSLRKENRTTKPTPTVVQAIEMRSSSSTPKSQSSARLTAYQESTPGSGYTSATNLDLENGVSNGTLGKRKQAVSIGSGKDTDTMLKSLGTLTNPIIKKFTINGASHTAVLVTSHHPVILANGYTLNTQSPVVIVDDDDGTSSASPDLTLNRDDEANSANPVNLNEDGNTGSASPVVMMDLDESVGSAGSVIMVDRDTDSPRPVVMVNGDGAGPADQNVTVNGVDEARPITPVPVLRHGFVNPAPSRPRLRANLGKEPFDSDAFDALIYAQPGALSPPKGVRTFGHRKKGSDGSQLDDRLYLHRDPAIQGMHERSEEWYRRKLALRLPGARKKWFGRVRERQRWLKSQQDQLSRPSDDGLRERGPKRKDPEPWAHQRSLDFGDVPEDDLPSYVKENPAWLKFCGRLRDARTKMDAADSSVLRRERAKQQAEVDKRSLTRKEVARRQLASKEAAQRQLALNEAAQRQLASNEVAQRQLAPKAVAQRPLAPKEVAQRSLTKKEVAQRQLASKFMRQTEEFYNSMKQA